MPTTEAGKRQHDEAWGDWEREPGSFVNGHTPEREGCPACAEIAAIEAEAYDKGRHDVAVRGETGDDLAYQAGFEDGRKQMIGKTTIAHEPFVCCAKHYPEVPAAVAAERERIIAELRAQPTPPRLFALSAWDLDCVEAIVRGEQP